MNRIFISYKRVDKDRVFGIRDLIEEHIGHECWIDLEGIESDAQFKNVIIHAINKCEVVLFMYSKAHSEIRDFEKDWTIRELNFASSKNKRIVFVNIDGTPLTDEFMFDYGLKQQVDARSSNALDRLIKDLHKWLDIPVIEPSKEKSNNNVNKLNNMAIVDTPSTIATDEFEITIADNTTPIVLLFGPPTSGKSMMLSRLIRYLAKSKSGYSVACCSFFRPSHDLIYRTQCDQFFEKVNSNEAFPGNTQNEVLLIKIKNNDIPVCQILEAPGEHYFNPNKTDTNSFRKFPPYLTKIMNSPNKKIWVFFTEAEWNVHASVKRSYVNHIKYCKFQKIRKSDRIIILYNKADKNESLCMNGRPLVPAIKKAMFNEYEGLSTVFTNTNPITSLWHSYNFRFVPFSTGDYIAQAGGKQIYCESNELYPKFLWDQLMKCINK